MKLVIKSHRRDAKNPACRRQAGCKPRTEGSGKPSQQIEVTDSELNITTNYNSVKEAASSLNIKQSRISLK